MRIQVLLKFFLIFIINFNLAYASEKISIYPQNGNAVINILLDNNDIIYWHKKTKLGLPTKIEINNPQNLKSYKISWPWPKFKQESHYSYGYYEGLINIPIIIEPADREKETSFVANLAYLLCNDSGCMQKSHSLSFSTSDFSKAQNIINFENDAYIENNKLYISQPQKNSETILSSSESIYLPNEYKFIDGNSYSIFDLEKISDKNHVLTSLNSLSGEGKKFNISEVKIKNTSHALIYYIYAFIGGLILNFMPCVLPILSIKLFSLLKNTDKKSIITNSYISIITILSYFISIAVITIIMKELGKFFSPGLSLQSPYIIIFCLALVVGSMSLIRGKLILDLIPSFLQKNNSSVEYINTIISTLTSTILATPCTAPFLATSMTFALSQTDDIIFIMFLLSGLGFAMPYFLVIINPKILILLPKSGKWQERLKDIFLLLLFITVIWLLYVTNSLLGTYATLALFLLIYLFRYSLEMNLQNRYKIPLITLVFLSLFSLPITISGNFKKFEEKYEEIWDVFSSEALDRYVKNGNIVVVYVTADWCATCQINKLLVLDRLDTKMFFLENNVKLLEADITQQNTEAEKYLYQHNVSGIPYTRIYSPNMKEGLALPVLLTYNIITSNIENLKIKVK